MTWVRIESGFLRHRKIIDLPINAKMLFLAGLCYSAENGTDGFVSHSALRIISAETRVAPRYAADLHRAGLWHKQADGWDIHDYLVYQPSAEQERQRRQVTADRVKSWREKKSSRRNGVTETVTNADGHGVTNEVRNASRNGGVTLSPNPNPSSNSSPQGTVVGEHGCDDDRIRSIAKLIAHRRIDRLAKPPDSPKAYLRTVTADIVTEHGDTIARKLEAFPTATDQAIAEQIEPPAPPRPPDPLEQSAIAQRKRDARIAAAARGEACPTCDGLGVTDAGDGTFDRCTNCQP